MKKEILLILLVLIYFSSTAQYTFQYTFEKEFTDPSYLINTISGSPIKTDDGGFVMLLWKGNSDEHFNNKLIKINNKGEIVKQKEIYSDTISIYTINKTKDNNYVCIGMAKSDTSEYKELAIIKLNSDFEVVEKKQYYQPYGELGNYDVIRNYKNNFVMAGYFMRVDGQRVYQFPFIFEFTENGDSIRMKYFKNSLLDDFTILENKDSSGYRLFCNDGLTEDVGWPAINMLDTDFNVDTAYALPYQTSLNPPSWMNLCKTKWLTDDKYILSYETVKDSNPWWDFDLGISIMNASTNKLNVEAISGKLDTTEGHAFYGVDFIDKNNIYYVGTSNLIFWVPVPWQKEPSWILLNKYDSTLNLKWQKYYGGDVCYLASSVVATQDGGCLITGVKYNYKQNNYLSAYLLKVDSLGNYQTTGINKVIEPKNYVLFPNPVTNSFNINLSPASKAKKIELYDIAGKLILSKQLTSSQTNINISYLSKGIYVYRIKNKENIIDTGKLVKQ